MAMLCGAFGFQWSHWNSDVGVERIALRVCRCTQTHWQDIQEGVDPEEVRTAPMHAMVLLTLTERAVFVAAVWWMVDPHAGRLDFFVSCLFSCAWSKVGNFRLSWIKIPVPMFLHKHAVLNHLHGWEVLSTNIVWCITVLSVYFISKIPKTLNFQYTVNFEHANSASSHHGFLQSIQLLEVSHILATAVNFCLQQVTSFLDIKFLCNILSSLNTTSPLFSASVPFPCSHMLSLSKSVILRSLCYSLYINTTGLFVL